MPAKSASTCARPSPGSPSPLTAIRKLPSPPASASPASRAAMTARRRSWRVQTRRSTPPKERAAIRSLPTPPSLPGRNLTHKWLEHQPFSDAAVSARGPKRWPTGAALPRAPCGLPSKLLGGLHFGCRSAFLPRGNCGRRDQRDFGAARRNGARMSLYNSNPHGFSGPPHLLRPVRCDRPKRLGVASSCYAALGRSKARSGQRPLWSTTWQAGVRGCSDFYPAADVSHGPGHQSFSRPIFLKANFSQGQFFSRPIFLKDWRSRWVRRASAPRHRERYSKQMAARAAKLPRHRAEAAPLLDLGFLEGHVLAGDRIIFLEGKLLSGRAWVLLGHIEEAGSRRTQEFDLLGDGLGHGDISAALIAGTLFGRDV